MSKKQVLLVEDDPEISNAVAFRLRKKGYQVSTAANGEDGLQWALKNIPDIVILDLFLPGMAGEEVCKAIREHDDDRIQSIPIVMLTAKTMIADRIVGKVIGANVYLTKPFEMENLLAEIHRLIENHKPAGLKVF